jgi:AcrR family transcriptional regulator
VKEATAGGSEGEDSSGNHTRARIFEAAKQVLAEKGLSVDVHQVIARAGVGAGTVYRHFVSKEALFRAVAEEMITRTRARFIEIATHDRDARRCIAELMELGFHNLEEYGQLAIELFAGIEPPEYGSFFERPALEAYFRALIERGIRQGHFRADLDLEHAVGVWFALTAPSMLGRLLAGRTVEEVARATTRFFLAGLGPAGNAG